MVNQSECSVKFKKICDRSVASTKNEMRAAKNYSKHINNYSTINDCFKENERKLNAIKTIIKRKTQKIQELSQVDNNQLEELNKIKDETKILQDKIIALQNNESGKKLFQKQLLQFNVLKMCTKTYISDKKTPHIIRGFTANSEHSTTIPFEIDSGRKTNSEIEEALWENSMRCSENTKQWEHLFTI